MTNSEILYATWKTPVGLSGVAATPKGLCRLILRLANEDTFVRTLKEETGAVLKRNAKRFQDVIGQLDLFFRGQLENFDCRLDLGQGTLFQQRVWRQLGKIPYGKTRSYQWLAKAIGQPLACRAVGAANGRNPVPVIIPCHRVIQTNGHLGGFTGGLDLKRILLDLEKKADGTL